MNWCYICAIFMACVGVVAILQHNWLGLSLDVIACFCWIMTARKNR